MARFNMFSTIRTILLSCLATLFCGAGDFAQEATASNTTDPKTSEYIFTVEEPDSFVHGLYEIQVFDKGKWWYAGRMEFGKRFTEKKITFSRIPNIEGRPIFRIIQKGGGAAHIDSVSFGGESPSGISGISEADAKKINKTDYDVIDAFGKTIELTFPKNVGEATFILNARVESRDVSKTAFRFPRTNTYKEDGNSWEFYSYELDENVGALSLQGKEDEVKNAQPIFEELTKSASGHPDGITYGYVQNDDENLYVVIDFTGDNTLDGEKDYSKVYVKTDTGVKEFTLSENKTKWGAHHFIYTDKVEYQHKYYEFKIPLKEIGNVKRNERILLAFAAYGTLSDYTANPDPIDFGDVEVGDNLTIITTIKDIGTGTGWICTYDINGSDSGQYSFALNTCPGSPQQLGVNGTCTIDVTCKPTSPGEKTATLTVGYQRNNDNACPSVTDLDINLVCQASSTLVAQVTGNGIGWISSSPAGIDCPKDCTEPYGNETVRLAATADPESEFIGWGGDRAGTWRGADCYLYIDEDKLAIAEFRRWDNGITHIDGHSHFDPDGNGAARLISEKLASTGLMGTILMPAPQTVGQANGYTLDDLTSGVSAYSGLFIFLGGGGSLNVMIQQAIKDGEVTNRARTDFRAKAMEILSKGAVGFGEMAVELLSADAEKNPYITAPPDHPLFLLLADIAAENDVPIDIHMEALPVDMPLADGFRFAPKPGDPESEHRGFRKAPRLQHKNQNSVEPSWMG